MEKGGEQSDEDNPFSFKAFLKRGTEDPAEKKKAKKPGTRKKKSQPATDTTTQQGKHTIYPLYISRMCTHLTITLNRA